MNCQEFRVAHLAFTDDALAPDLAAAARSHLDACESCARYDCLVRRATLVARNLPGTPLRAGAHARVMARVREDVRRRRRQRAILVTCAATAASIAIIAAMFGFGATPPAATPTVATRSAAPVPAPVLPIVIPRAPPMRREFSAAVANPALSFIMSPAPGRVRFADAQLPPFLAPR
jgi:hypothetical protein